MKPLSAGIALAIVAAIAFVYSRSPTTAQPSTASTRATPLNEDTRVLAAKLERLQHELDALEVREDSGPDAPAVHKVQLPAEQPPDSIGGTSAEEVQTRRAADLEQHREYMSSVAERFAAERIDSTWALQMSARIHAAFEDHPALQGLSHDIDCRARTCRVTIENDGSGRISTRLPTLALSVTDVLPSISAERVDQGNGRSAMVLYMSAADPSATRPSK
jgi:hypothetical protein